MKVTKSQKVYFGLLAVGLIALGADRFVLTPPAAQAADNAQSLLVKPADSSAGISNATPLPTTVSIQSNPIADKLKQLNDSIPAPKGEIRDAFTPGAAWTPPVKSSMADAPVENFSQTHHLTGVLVSGRSGQAMVDSKDVLVGQTLDGFKLIAVKPGMAVFAAGDLQTTLRIAMEQ